jgi:hypothetical protein
VKNIETERHIIKIRQFTEPDIASFKIRVGADHLPPHPPLSKPVTAGFFFERGNNPLLPTGIGE